MSYSILGVYFLFRTIFAEVYLQYSSMSAGQNNSKSSHNLWSKGLVVRVQIYQTKDSRFKTIRWLKNCLSLSPFKDQSNEYQGFLGAWWLKKVLTVTSFTKLNSIHEVVHWDKWTLKKVHEFFVKYSWSILLKYSWSMLKGAATGMRYFARSKFSRNLVHKKRLAWYDKYFSSYDMYLVKRGRIPFLSLNELGEKLQAKLILCKFVNKP